MSHDMRGAQLDRAARERSSWWLEAIGLFVAAFGPAALMSWFTELPALAVAVLSGLAAVVLVVPIRYAEFLYHKKHKIPLERLRAYEDAAAGISAAYQVIEDRGWLVLEVENEGDGDEFSVQAYGGGGRRPLEWDNEEERRWIDHGGSGRARLVRATVLNLGEEARDEMFAVLGSWHNLPLFHVALKRKNDPFPVHEERMTVRLTVTRTGGSEADDLSVEISILPTGMDGQASIILPQIKGRVVAETTGDGDSG